MAAENKLIQLLTFLYTRVKTIDDPRKPSPATKIRFLDIVFSAFSVFFMQFPSFLSFQKSMEKDKGENNCRTLFGIKRIPTDNHIRKVLDKVKPEAFFSVFLDLLNYSQEKEILLRFHFKGLGLLLAVDGTEYYRSLKIHCDKCSTRNVNGTIHYIHSALTTAFVHPDLPHVLPLPPEFIVQQDGNKKQDCERNSFKRWTANHDKLIHNLPITFLGDDLYANDPGCRMILAKGHNFVLTCKPKSHKWLFDLVENSDTVEVNDHRWTGRKQICIKYRFINDVSIRDSEDALHVNWCEYEETDNNGNVLKKNSYITNHEITVENIREIIRAGRCRWKIENEAINTLKTKGYHFEHNFGHGKKHLSMTLLTLNMIAFFFHTILEYVDSDYRKLRKALPSRKTFFQDMSALTRYFCFPGWKEMISFMLQGLKQKHDPAKMGLWPP